VNQAIEWIIERGTPGRMAAVHQDLLETLEEQRPSLVAKPVPAQELERRALLSSIIDYATRP
jgi:hypothetical protein